MLSAKNDPSLLSALCGLQTLSVSSVTNSRLSAITAITWSIPIGTTVSRAVILTATLFVARVHMFIRTSRLNHIAAIITEPTVTAIEAWRRLAIKPVSGVEHVPGFVTLAHLQARLSRLTGSATASTSAEASRATFSTASMGAGSGRAKALPVMSRAVMRVLIGSIM